MGGGRTLDNPELSQDRGFGEGAFEKKTQAMLKLWESCKVSIAPQKCASKSLILALIAQLNLLGWPTYGDLYKYWTLKEYFLESAFFPYLNCYVNQL